jgi:photosystem II stability/assembly factor-like uncharacterized protein
VVVGYGGKILKSTDAGNHWSVKQSGTQSNLNAVAFSGFPLYGYAVGNGVVCHSTDGGETWSASAVTGNFVCVAIAGIALDPDIHMGTDNGKIRYSYNDGNTWNESFISNSRIATIANRRGPLNGTLTMIASQDSVYQIFGGQQLGVTATARGFWDEIVSGSLKWQTLYLVGGGGNPGVSPLILRRSSSDTVWQRITSGLPIPLMLTDVQSFSDTVVYICGSAGRIFRSADNGNSWLQQITPTKQLLHAISFFTHDLGFVVGDSGLILHTANGGLTSVGSINHDRIPLHASLSPNYPNPFNPTTKIHFSIDRSSMVTLKIYNVIGQEIESLLSAWQDAGTYTLTWDATQFTSGVYFCKLVAGNFVAMQKLVLTK